MYISHSIGTDHDIRKDDVIVGVEIKSKFKNCFFKGYLKYIRHIFISINRSM